MANRYIPKKMAAFGAYEVTPPVCEVKLDANESFIELPDEIKEKVMNALQDVSLSRYPDPMANKACEAFSALYGVNAAFLTAGNGSDELIGVIINALLEHGQRAMMVTPDFSMYKFYCDLAEITCLRYEKADDLVFDPEDIIRAVKRENIHMLLFSNPCNPTGQGLCREKVRKIVKSVDALVVLDEAYMDFWDQSMLREADQYDNLIILKTCSKSVGMAAIRMGFAIANKEIADTLKKAKSPYNVNALTQAAAGVVLSQREYLKGCTRKILLSRDQLFKGLEKIRDKYPECVTLYPTTTNFVLLSCKKADEVYDYLKANGVLIRKLGEPLLRVSCGSERENDIFLRTFERALREAGK